MSQLRLYRGDSSPVRIFNISKTKDYSLVGKGIYLTSSFKVAESYREKEYLNYRTEIHVLYKGMDAFKWKENAFNAFVALRYKEINNNKNKEIPKSFILQCSNEWDKLIDENSIIIEKKEVLVHDNLSHITKANSKSSSKVPYEKLIKAKTQMFYTASLKGKNKGRVTAFDFDQDYFERNIVTLFKPIDFHQRAEDLKVILKNYALMNYEYGNPIVDRILLHNKYVERGFGDPYKESVALLKKAGFIGFEYQGGVRTGNFIKHRAFCIWDEDFVNAAKVKVFI